MVDSAFKIWNSNGIHSFKDLYVDKIFASFTQLIWKYDVPQTNFFHYLQIHSFISSRYPQFPNLPTETTLDIILDINVYNRGVVKVI